MLSLVPFSGKVVGRSDGRGLGAMELEEHLKGNRYKLIVDNGQTRLVSMDAEVQIDTQSENAGKIGAAVSQRLSPLAPVGLGAFSIFFGLFLLCLIGGLMATIITLQNKSKKDNGWFISSQRLKKP